MKNLRNITKKNILNITLGLSVAFSAALGVTPSQVYAASSSTTTADSIIATGKHFLGTPYHYGATTGNTSSFDCSSFTQYVYKQNGISIPRDSRQQSQVGTYVPRSQLQPGDLVFFYSPIHHVAIYIGDGKILHTYGSPGVIISNLNSGWWSSHYTTARRVIPSSSSYTAGQTQKTSTTATTQPSTPSSSTASSYTLIGNANNELNNVESLLRQNGYKSYSTAADWFRLGDTISLKNVNRGDVLFFTTSGSKSTIEHVGVYAGSGKVLVKSNSSSQTYSISSSLVKNSFVIAKRHQ